MSPDQPEPSPAEHGPRRLDQATVKGALLVIAGAAIIATPDSNQTLGRVAGLLMVGWGLAELWFRVVSPGRQLLSRQLSVAESIVVVAVGTLLVIPTSISISVWIGLYLAVRGLFALLRAWRGGADRHERVVAGLSLMAAGAVVFFAPETVLLGARALLGAAAIGVGVLLVMAGVGRRPANLSREEISTASIARIGTDWLRARRLAAERRDELADTLFFEPPGRASKLMSFWVMMLLSVGIASFAVIQNSTAVVIGAMLVAPLMGPIMGVAAAIVNGWPGRLVASLILVAAAVAAAVALAWLIAAWLPSVGDLATNAQIQSRVSPTLLDLCIAITAGAAGAYATVDPRTSSSLPGVAIAVALVPPLAVVGITLQAREWADAGGAFLLFSTNFVSIVLAGSLVFFLTGFAVMPFTADKRSPVRRAFQSVVLGALLILIPLSITSQAIWTDASNEGDARQAVEAWIPGDADLSIQSLDVKGDVVELVVSGSTLPPDTASLQDSLSEAFGTPVTLRARYLPSVALTPGEAPSAVTLPGGS